METKKTPNQSNKQPPIPNQTITTFVLGFRMNVCALVLRRKFLKVWFVDTTAILNHFKAISVNWVLQFIPVAQLQQILFMWNLKKKLLQYIWSKRQDEHLQPPT